MSQRDPSAGAERSASCSTSVLSVSLPGSSSASSITLDSRVSRIVRLQVQRGELEQANRLLQLRRHRELLPEF
ncbi:MAG: hypothetical protein V9F00_14585 [Nocardioides sp.]